MIVIPAVDISGAKCVQLVQGKAGTEKYYGDPIEVAKGWEEKGAQVLHLVDIDAALGRGDNLKIVERIKNELSVPIQFGGGIRDIKRARQVLDSGVDRVIIGTAAVKDPEIVKRLSREYGKDRLMVAVDSIDKKVVVKGWTEKTGINTIDFIKKLEDYVFGFLVTDVDCEGLMSGIDKGEFSGIIASTAARICASGGISTKKDIDALEKMGAWGCVIGKALYESRLNPDLRHG